MRSPALTMADNLMWTRSGAVWATWRLSPLPYGYRPAKDKLQARALHRMLVRSRLGESLLLGVAAGLDPAVVVERMIEGIPLDESSDWAYECAATLESLDELPLGQRLYFLSVPLRHASPWALAAESLRAAVADLQDALALPRAGVSERELATRREQAAAIQKTIPAPFRAQPVTAAQLTWLHGHAQTRGLYLDLDLPETSEANTTTADHQRTAAALRPALLDEGGRTDLDRTARSAWSPLHRKYLKVVNPDTPELTSYQVLLAMADVPADGMVFPGSEYLGRVDDAGVDADWAVRLHVRSRDEVARKNRKAVIGLNDQFQQREGELSTGPHDLYRSARDLTELQAKFDADSAEVEVEATTIFAVAAPDPDTASDRAAALISHYAAGDYKIVQPLGGQESLWWAMTPGTPAGRIVREFAQLTTSDNFAAAVPLTCTDLGDPTGPLLGLNISTGQTGVVHHDPAGAATRLDVSGSLAVAGELGAGKSVTLKKIAVDTVDRGGRFIAADRTNVGEWATMAASITNASVINILQPEVSLDPLRLFGQQTGARVAQSFLTPLLNLTPTSDLGICLAEVLDPDYLRRHELTSLGQLVQHLQADCTLPDAASLGRRVNVFARRDLGRVIFDPNLRALSLTARAIIFHTAGLELPEAEELRQEHLFNQMRLERIYGRAMYALIAAIARTICFARRDELALFVVDEAHHVTASPEGQQELRTFVRDGRKHQAAVALGSHDPEADFGDETLRGLIPTRILMRHRDKTLAQRGLRWLDLNPDDEDLVELITQHTSPVGADGVPEHRRGEALMRDATGNVGRIRVLQPALPSRREAINTTPPPVVPHLNGSAPAATGT